MKFDTIYITGGSTSYLAKRVREVNFDKIIEKMIFANKVYIGMSAGSMLLMPNFDIDDIHNSCSAGLNLINAYFSVHCNIEVQNRSDLPLPHIALRENTAIEVRWDGYELIEGHLQYEP